MASERCLLYRATAGVALLVASAAALGPSPGSARGGPAVAEPRASPCIRRTGRGWGPTEHFARLRAWEVVAQATGNWPIQSDAFEATRYTCRADRGGRLCQVTVDVCRRA